MQLKALQSPLAQAEMEAALGAVPQQVPAAKARVRRRASVPVVDRRGRAPAHDLARVAYMATRTRLPAGSPAPSAGEPAGGLVRVAMYATRAKSWAGARSGAPAAGAPLGGAAGGRGPGAPQPVASPGALH